MEPNAVSWRFVQFDCRMGGRSFVYRTTLKTAADADGFVTIR
jgi:hypothetical protein